MKIGRALPAVGLTLSLLGAGIAGYLTVEHGRGASPICGFGQGCEVVAQSTYASLGGIPTAAFGLLLYLSLGVLYGVRLFSPPPATVEAAFRLATLGATAAGTGVSAWLTHVQLYVLHAVCVWCAVSAAIVTLMLVVAAIDVLRRQASPDLSALGQCPNLSGGKGRSTST
jgi:uncharacterized membrane protein